VRPAGLKDMSDMFFHRIFRHGNDILLAIADKELLGKTLKDNDIEIVVEESFYGSELIGPEKLIELTESCTIANIVGKKAVTLLADRGLVDRDNILKIGDSFHAQIIKII